MLARDFDAATAKLRAHAARPPRLRPYQIDANAAIERAIADRKRQMLVAMATGTGKTFTLVNQIYRLMKSGVARRVLFLVDRRALAAQAVRAFAAFEAEPSLKFTRSTRSTARFQKEDFGEDDRFDPKVLPQGYLTDPQPGTPSSTSARSSAWRSTSSADRPSSASERGGRSTTTPTNSTSPSTPST